MVNELLDKIGSLSLIQAAELVKAMEEKFGISAAMPIGVAAGATPGISPAPEAEKQTEFTVILDSFDGDKKVDAIKKVREITGLPLMDAKKMVDAGNGELKKGILEEEANKIKSDFEALGCKISLK